MEKRICKECGKEFVLTDGEIAFFNSKGLNLPKRCKECRNRKKPKPDFSDFSIDSFRYSGPKKKTYGFKFILPIAFAVIVAIACICGALNQKTGDTEYTTNASGNNSLSQQDDYEGESRSTETGDAAYEAEDASSYSPPKQNGYVSESADTVTAEKKEKEIAVSSGNRFTFRNSEFREEHFQKHGISMGFKTAEEYEMAASKVVSNTGSKHKREAEDNDTVYYLESTNELVILSTDGYIRTYFCPDDGIEYYERQ